ncbi:hypothetical protein M9Y10_006754 [Tritrichomonas musculus]|uniref:Serine/threonine-protein phosphatase n=1 Tax=Tritrichomonas musculus TaxID=1915356 RepID=A0ABR2JF17_9EUKA
MGKSAQYILSSYSFIFTHTQDKLLDVGYQPKNGDPIPSFDENVLIDLCTEVQQIFEKESNVLEIEGDVIIVGDIHGSFHDLLRILKFIQERNSRVIFLGDYVDRGNFSLECVTLLFALKVVHPDLFYLIRGNHEFDSICSQYGFKEEILNYYNPKKVTNPTLSKQKQLNLKLMKAKSLILYDNLEPETQPDEYYSNHIDRNCYKYTEELYNAFIKAFSYLPIAAIANKTTFCIHGGLSPKLDHVDTINTNIARPITKMEESQLLSDVVWSDPSCSSCLFDDNPRGRGYLFNRESVSLFLKNNSFNRMIRAHQCVKKGTLSNFGDQCITVFSASSYDKMGNFSSILQLFQQDDVIKVTTFPPLERLQKSEAFYYKVQALNPNEEKSHVCFSLMHPKLITRTPIVGKGSRQIKPFKSENTLTLSSSSFRLSSLVKPKFTTNQRKSFNCVQRRPIIIDKTKDFDDVNNKTIEILPASVC